MTMMTLSQLRNSAETRGFTIDVTNGERVFYNNNFYVWQVRNSISGRLAFQSAWLINGRYTNHKQFPDTLDGFRCALDRFEE